MGKSIGVLCVFVLFVSSALAEGSLQGNFEVNGNVVSLNKATAIEVDSPTEKGFMDVVVVLSDRDVPTEAVADEKQFDEFARKEGLSALRVVIDPDARIKSAAPYHPSMKSHISSGAFINWTPSAFDEHTVAGKFSTDGQAVLMNQTWKYDLAFSAPIVLDPEAKTVPN